MSTFENSASPLWGCSVSHYESWFDHADQPMPSIQFVDAMQRRRLSRLAKVSLGLMHCCVQECPPCPVVYASRHGEIARTTELLAQLAANEQVSPMGFSLAVLNATVGLYSIATNNQLPSSAVSAGERTFEMGLFEAAMQAQVSQSPVLYVFADEPLPSLYDELQPPCVSPLHVLSMRVHPSATKGAVSLQCHSEASNHHPCLELQSQAFHQSWQTQQSGCWVGQGQQAWCWSFL